MVIHDAGVFPSLPKEMIRRDTSIQSISKRGHEKTNDSKAPNTPNSANSPSITEHRNALSVRVMHIVPSANCPRLIDSAPNKCGAPKRGAGKARKFFYPPPSEHRLLNGTLGYGDFKTAIHSERADALARR